MTEKKVICGNCLYRRSEGVCAALPPQIVPVAIASPRQSIMTSPGQEMSLAEIQLATAFPTVRIDGAICSLYTEKEEKESDGEPAEE